MKKSLFALAVSGLALVGTPAFAAGPYVFGQIGNANVDAGDSVYGSSLDDDDTYLGIGVGFKVTKNLGFEIGYHDFGKIESKYGSSDEDGFGNGKESLALDAISVAAVGTLPVGPSFNLFGKVGLDLWSAEWKDSYHEVYLGDAFSESDKVSDDGANVFFAVGAAFDISEYSSVFIEYQVHQFELKGRAYESDDGYDEVDLDIDADVLSVGINYSF